MPENETKKCAGCGYDLRGLEKNTICPECGSTSQRVSEKFTTSKVADRIMGMIDANVAVMDLSQMPDVRKRVRSWMLIGSCTVAVVATLQLAVTFAIIPIGMYRLLLASISVVWPCIVVGMLPSSADSSMPPMYRMLRPWIPISQWCWPAGFATWLAFHITGRGTLEGNLGKFWPIILLHLIGGIGVTALAFWLHDFAVRMHLSVIGKKLNFVAWAYLSWGLLVFALPWKHFAAAGLTDSQGAFMWWAYILGLMIPWLAVQCIFSKSLFDIALTAHWDMHYEKSLVGRQDRIREKRESMDKENDPLHE